MTLKELVESLEEPLRLTLSHIVITFDGREAVADFSFRALLTAPSAPPPDAKEEGRRSLPRNSLFSSDDSRLHPGRTYSLSLALPLDEQCNDLDRSTLVGNLRIERVQGTAEEVQQGYPLVTWTITTHAGSERERLDWGRNLIQRNLFRLAPPDSNGDAGKLSEQN